MVQEDGVSFMFQGVTQEKGQLCKDTAPEFNWETPVGFCLDKERCVHMKK